MMSNPSDLMLGNDRSARSAIIVDVLDAENKTCDAARRVLSLNTMAPNFSGSDSRLESPMRAT